MKYNVKIYIEDMGSLDCVVSTSLSETKEQAALWEINSARDHDGLPILDNIPRGAAKFEPIYE